MSVTQEKEAGADLVVSAAVQPKRMERLSAWAGRTQRGMTTAEYAVGTVAAVTFVGVLIKVLQDPTIFQLLLKLITWVLKQFWGG